MMPKLGSSLKYQKVARKSVTGRIYLMTLQVEQARADESIIKAWNTTNGLAQR